jgi:TonB family protein
MVWRIFLSSVIALSCATSGAKKSCDGSDGLVTVQFDVTATGEVANPSILESCPDDRFDQAAIDAVSKWRYDPGDGGKENVRVALRFDL